MEGELAAVICGARHTSREIRAVDWQRCGDATVTSPMMNGPFETSRLAVERVGEAPFARLAYARTLRGASPYLLRPYPGSQQNRKRGEKKSPVVCSYSFVWRVNSFLNYPSPKELSGV